MATRGYARVSTSDQNLDRQMDALKNYGIDVLYCEKMSGTKRSRPELDRMLSPVSVVHHVPVLSEIAIQKQKHRTVLVHPHIVRCFIRISFLLNFMPS